MRAIGVTVWSMYDYEADDALATGARRWVDDVDEVVVMTPDKDLSQIYDDPRIRGYDRRKGSFIDRDAVVEKFGVEPASIPDWLGLVGDAADALATALCYGHQRRLHKQLGKHAALAGLQ